MKLKELKEWLIPLSTFITLISTSAGVWISLKEYRLKLQSEIRLTESTQAEMDIRLLKLFTEITHIATGRKGDASTFSTEIVEKLFENNAITAEDFKNLDVLRSKIATAAFVEPVVGLSSRDAAFASIATLGIRHDVLREPAIQALESFKAWAPDISERYLKKIRESK